MNKKKLRVSILIYIPLFTLIFVNSFTNIALTSVNIKKDNQVQLAGEIYGEKQWINNSNFDSPEFWFIESQGDITDVDGIITENQANFKIIGEYWTFSNLSGIPKSSDWVATKKPGDSIYPDIFEINQYGCNAQHGLHEVDLMHNAAEHQCYTALCCF